MTLYEIDSAILDCIDMETGEIFDGAKFEELQLSRDEKIENICLWIKNLKAEAEALKQEKLSFEQRQNVVVNKMESLKNYISSYLNGTPFKSSKVQVSYRKSESLEISDDAVIPSEFLKAPEVDKTELKKAMKLGQKFRGVSIVEKQNIQIK